MAVAAARGLIARRWQAAAKQRLVMQTQKHLSAIGYFLLPKRSSGPLPALICLPGHGRGVSDILGLDDDGRVERRHDGAHEFSGRRAWRFLERAI